VAVRNPFIDVSLAVELPQEERMVRVPSMTEHTSPAKLVLNVESVGFTPEQFALLCRDNPDLRLELTAQREIQIMPPTYSDTGRQESEILYQLQAWAKRDGRGLVFGSSTGFTLPNGAIRSPDASWIPKEKWNALNRRQREESFAPICPDFVIELRSRSDTLLQLSTKMSEYIANGAELGFLIDPFTRQVHVYRPGRPPRRLHSSTTVGGRSLLPGFTLRLKDIWG